MTTEASKRTLNLTRSLSLIKKLRKSISSDSLSLHSRSSDTIFSAIKMPVTLETSIDDIHPLESMPIPQQLHSSKSFSLSELLIPLEKNNLSRSSLNSVQLSKLENDSVEETAIVSRTERDEKEKYYIRAQDDSNKPMKNKNFDPTSLQQGEIVKQIQSTALPQEKVKSSNAPQISFAISSEINSMKEKSLVNNKYQQSNTPIALDSERVAFQDYKKSKSVLVSALSKQSRKMPNNMASESKSRLGIWNGKEIESKVKTWRSGNGKIRNIHRVSFSASPNTSLTSPRSEHTTIDTLQAKNKQVKTLEIYNKGTYNPKVLPGSFKKTKTTENEIEKKETFQPEIYSKITDRISSALSSKYHTVPSKVERYMKSSIINPSSAEKVQCTDFNTKNSNESDIRDSGMRAKNIIQDCHILKKQLTKFKEDKPVLNKSPLLKQNLLQRENTITPDIWSELHGDTSISKQNQTINSESKGKLLKENFSGNMTQREPEMPLILNKKENQTKIYSNPNIANIPFKSREATPYEPLQTKAIPQSFSVCSNDSIKTITNKTTSSKKTTNSNLKQITPHSSSSLSLQSTISTVSSGSSTIALDNSWKSIKNFKGSPIKNTFQFSRPTSSSLLKSKGRSQIKEHHEKYMFSFLKRQEIKRPSSSSSVIPTGPNSRMFVFRKNLSNVSENLNISKPKRPSTQGMFMNSIYPSEIENKLEKSVEVLERAQEIVDPPSDLVYLSLLLLYILIAFNCAVNFL